MDAKTPVASFSQLRQPRDAQQIEITFDGSGGEYFRIWIVNLLLLLVTLGIYLPWAKVRKLRYFYNHTDIGGHALDFHGNARKMLRGTAFMGVFFLVYSQAAKLSPTAGLVAALIFVVIWPALWRASMQFRLANTSWRGMRFAFRGSMDGAYKALLPPMALAVLPAAWLGSVAANDPAKAERLDSAIGLVFLALVLCSPAFLWLLKRYQHGSYAYANLRAELRTGVGSFYGLTLRSMGVALLCVALLFGLFVAITGGGIALGSIFKQSGPRIDASVFAALLALVLFAYLLLIVVVWNYWTSRMQNLVWSRTGNRYLRFRSKLRFRSLLGLTIKNWLLMLVTLGLYWPFAAVAMYRLRVESVTLATRVSLDELVGAAHKRSDDATGDMAADLAGLDFGL